MHPLHLLLACCLSLGVALSAGENGPPPLKRTLHLASGTVQVAGNLATITVPEGCRYLSEADARFWIEDLWGNPPDESIKGLILPAAHAERFAALLATGEPLTDGPEDEASWGILVSWEGDTGHVSDSDAASTDFSALLKEMQASTTEANPERRKQGYPEVYLIGWAEPPHYDQATRKLYWAKTLRFGGEPEPQLNYCIRILGARGVLELNAVDSAVALPEVAKSAQLVLAGTSFTTGNRYEDYKEGVDPVAAGGIAALVAGGLLAKKAGLLVLILKFGKLLIIPLIFVGAIVVKVAKAVMNRSNEQSAQERIDRLS